MCCWQTSLLRVKRNENGHTKKLVHSTPQWETSNGGYPHLYVHCAHEFLCFKVEIEVTHGRPHPSTRKCAVIHGTFQRPFAFHAEPERRTKFAHYFCLLMASIHSSHDITYFNILTAHYQLITGNFPIDLQHLQQELPLNEEPHTVRHSAA